MYLLMYLSLEGGVQKKLKKNFKQTAQIFFCAILAM